jgi:hypothetical protein
LKKVPNKVPNKKALRNLRFFTERATCSSNTVRGTSFVNIYAKVGGFERKGIRNNGPTKKRKRCQQKTGNFAFPIFCCFDPRIRVIWRLVLGNGDAKPTRILFIRACPFPLEEKGESPP